MPPMTRTKGISSAMLVACLLGSLLAAGGPEAPALAHGLASGSKLAPMLPAMPGSLVGAGHGLAPPLPDHRSEGEA